MTDPITALFLPGILAPAVVRYAALLRELGSDVRAWTKELEVYAQTPSPEDYAIADEVDGLRRLADRLRLRRFHLVAHSGGGAVALAFTAAHPDRVLSLAVDEPAFDFTPGGLEELAPYFALMPELVADPQAAMPRFLALELQPGVQLPAAGAPLPNRPAGVAALLQAFQHHQVDADAYQRFAGPALYMRGTLSADRFANSARRLATLFPHYQEVAFEGFSHVNTAHQADPQRVAHLLLGFWASAPRS